MWQRKQTIYLVVAVILTVICLCTQIGSYNAAGLDVSQVYNLWFTDPLGHRHFDVWPLFAILLPTAALGAYTIFIYRNRKIQALFCALNALLIVGWYGGLCAEMASRYACDSTDILSDGKTRDTC